MKTIYKYPLTLVDKQTNNGHEVYHVFLNELVSVPINPKKP